MTAPDRLTAARIFLSPVFFVIFALSQSAGAARSALLIALAVVFAVIEVTDALDGVLARATGSVSDLGKILDPFADSVSRLTYFICFASAGIMPLWVLLLVVYRDTAVAFARLLAARRGHVMAARFTGKLKAWVYAVAGIAGMVRLWARGLLIPGGESTILITTSEWLFVACGLAAAGSLIDYLFPVLCRKN
jgi:CDP-diacylglycerol--glycerol-3-phosphate 3-phosphatidyltransferase